jgi:RepB DNA-primase from phage plasmid
MTIAKANPAGRKLQYLFRLHTCRFVTALENTYVDDLHFHCIAESKTCCDQVKRSTKARLHLPRMTFSGPLSRHETTLRKRNAEGFAVYLSLNLMNWDVKAENCYTVRAIALSLNNVPLPTVWRNNVRPDIVINTSPGSHLCLFRVFLCEDFEMDVAEDVGRRLAAFYGGDPSVADRAVSVRLPGFANHQGRPFLVRLVTVDDLPGADGTFHDYELDAFSFLPRFPKHRTTGLNSNSHSSL